MLSLLQLKRSHERLAKRNLYIYIYIVSTYVVQISNGHSSRVLVEKMIDVALLVLHTPISLFVNDCVHKIKL
jgi:hypothetical protein